MKAAGLTLRLLILGMFLLVRQSNHLRWLVSFSMFLKMVDPQVTMGFNTKSWLSMAVTTGWSPRLRCVRTLKRRGNFFEALFFSWWLMGHDKHAETLGFDDEQVGVDHISPMNNGFWWILGSPKIWVCPQNSYFGTEHGDESWKFGVVYFQTKPLGTFAGSTWVVEYSHLFSVLPSMVIFPTSSCGVLVFDSVSRPPPPPPPPPAHTTLTNTIFHTPLCHPPSFTHNFVAHNFVIQIFVTHHLSHTTLSPTIFHTHLCHTPSFTHTYNFVTHTIFHTHLCHTPSFTHTHHLSHTSLSQTIFRTHLCHTPSFTLHYVTHNFVKHHLSHTSLSHTIFHTPLCHTHNFVKHHLSHTCLSHTTLSNTIFHTHLCHTPSFTHIFVTHHLVLGDINLRFTWQVWRLETSTCVGRGRRGTWRHLPAFGVAGVALVALGGALGRRWSPLFAVGRPGCRAAWQAWHYLRLAWQA